MVVVITNITDVPGDLSTSPQDVDVWNKRLSPGSTMKLPARLVDKRVRKLEAQGLIAVGAVPPWYVRAKTKGSVRTLSMEEKAQRTVKPVASPPPQAVKVEAKSEVKPDIKPKPVVSVETVPEEQEPRDEIKDAYKKQKR